MVLTRLVMTLAFGLTSVGIAFAQEHSPVQANLASPQILATLTKRAELFEAKAKLVTQCAKALRLIQKVMNLTEPNEDNEEEQWTRETFLLVRMWFTQEQQDEWYFAGKEFAVSMVTDMDQAHTKEEAMATYKRGFALIMNAQIAALEKMSDDLDARRNRIKELRSSD